MIPDFKKKDMKYKPEYCDDMIKYMERGLSNIEIAAKFRISEMTFYRWLKDHEEFQEAHDIGNPIRFAYLMAKADQIFLEERNDKGYKHWLKKISYMYKDYSPEVKQTATTNNIQIGNVNMVEYQGKSEAQLYEILLSKMQRLKPVEIEVKAIEATPESINNDDQTE